MDERILSLPKALIAEHGTRDPFKLADRLGISVRYINTKRQKGFCTNILNNYYIHINENLSSQMQRMTCAHELGHILLHKDRLRRKKDGRFQRIVEMELFDITSSTEYEANLFAANLLIDENVLADLLQEERDIVSIASSLDVNVNLLALKLAEMKKGGEDLRIPFTPDRRFMGKIEDRADSI
ncbi:MAG: ImmA/IrrE family metallo-endopeptidase [Eubacterium sp.]|nr:ImmA/IrrE family metallo-endopeptidase [Eubacterium sp.]